MKRHYKSFVTALGTILIFALSMPDKFLELYKEFLHSGFTPAFIVALAIWASKEIRNKRLDRRDVRWEKKLDSILTAVGVQDISKPEEVRSLRRLFFWSRKGIPQVNQRRKTKMMQFLRTNISKKLLALLVGIGVTALNKKFDLQLSPDETLVILLGVLGYITGQSYVDGRKALANTVTAVSQVVQTSTGITADTTYKDLFPTIKSVHEGINKLLSDVQKNDASNAFHDAAGAYLSIMDIIKSIEQPQPLPEIPVQQESA